VNHKDFQTIFHHAVNGVSWG